VTWPLLGAVALVARTQLRRRWPALVAIGLLIGLAGAVAGGGAALSRRTATAYDRLERATLVPDLQVTMTSSPDLAFRAAAAVPGVAGVWVTRVLVARVEDRPDVSYIGALEGHPVGSDPGAYTPVLLSGRFYNPDAREAVLDERAAARYGVHIGDKLPLRMLTQSDYNNFDTGFDTPGGPPVSVRVTGLVRMAGLGQDQTPLLLAPAAAAELPSVGMLVAIRLRPAPDAVARADAALAKAAALAAKDHDDPDSAEFPVLGVTHPETDSDPRVAATRRVVVTGLVVFIVAVAITGLATAAVAFRRHYDRRAAEQRIEAVLGLPAGGRVAARMLAALPAALLAGLTASAGPMLAGSLPPIGPLAVCEPHPGYAPNLAVAVCTGLIAATVTVLLVGWTAARAGRPGRDRRTVGGATSSQISSRPPVAGGWVLGRSWPGGRGPGPAWPGPAWLWVGVRFAVGSRSVPLTRRPALLTAAAAVAALVAAATVGQGVTRLVDEPSRYGWSFDLYVNDVRPDIVTGLRADPWISAVSESAAATVQVGAGCSAGSAALGTATTIPAPTGPPALTGIGPPVAPGSAAPTGPRALTGIGPPVLTGIGTPVAAGAGAVTLGGLARTPVPGTTPGPTPAPAVAAAAPGSADYASRAVTGESAGSRASVGLSGPAASTDPDGSVSPGAARAPTVPVGLAGAARPAGTGSTTAAAGTALASGPAAARCVQFPAYAFTAASGHVGWTVLAGRLVAGPGEVVVGTRAASMLGVRVGDVLQVAPGPTRGDGSLRLAVVGIGLGPAISGERLGANLLVDPRTLDQAAQTAPMHEAFVRAADGVPASRLVTALGTRYEVVVREPPDEVANLGGIGRLPQLLQVVLGLLAAGALAHTVISGWRRRAAEVAVLRVLGATPPRTGAVAVTAAGVAALAALVLGMPVGLGIGRLVWWEIADAIGVGTDAAFPTRLLLGLPVVAMVLAVVVAIAPAVSRRWLLPRPRGRGD
jgi:hypothetical protein